MKKSIIVFFTLVVACAMSCFAQSDILVWKNGSTTRMLRVDSVSFVAPPVETKHDYVDLGLPSGLKWATCNIGANQPFGYGDLFAWGETVSKDEFNWKSYEFVKDGFSAASYITKYTVDDGYESGIWYSEGNFVGDSLYILLPEDDVASVIWGDGWRMPTKAELLELIDNCTWKWTKSYNGTGVAGRIGISKNNGNTIFLPAAGYSSVKYARTEYFNEEGCYWSSELRTGNSKLAWYLLFSEGRIYDYSNDRFRGFSVRAVVAE